MKPPPPESRQSRHKAPMQQQSAKIIRYGQKAVAPTEGGPATLADLDRVASFLEQTFVEIDTLLEPNTRNPHLHMILHLLRGHIEGRLISATSMASAAGVPYATALRKLADIQNNGLIEQRPRTKTGKSFSLHPSPLLLAQFQQLAERIDRIASTTLGEHPQTGTVQDYFFGGSYVAGQSTIPPLPVRQRPLKLPGGLRILVHVDPTFMVMDNLKRQFDQIVGTDINQRAFSIDRLRQEVLRNADRKKSSYDLIAVDLPWMGELIEKGIIRPLPDVMDITRLEPSDFHTAGWGATHWNNVPYGVPSQTTPELLFYRKDWFAQAGLNPPTTTIDVITAAKHFHDPKNGRYGVAWNAARGTALGHTFLTACAAFGQPVVDLPPVAGGFDASQLGGGGFRPMFDTPQALAAADYLLELLRYSPPDILSMSWYERVRPYAAGHVAMAYGYTLLAPYFELDETCSAHGNTGYLPQPHGPDGAPIAPVGGYAFCIPSNLSEDRVDEAVEALITFTSPAAQKLYVQHGSRTSPRYSVAADPEVRRLSPIFEVVDQMSWRDELQFWPRPPIPQISDIIQICGHELHDMLRGIASPPEALARVQARAEELMH